MSKLGYKFEDMDGTKLTYRKNAKYSIQILVIDQELKYINPILVPQSVILRTEDFKAMYKEFEELRKDAKRVRLKSDNKWNILN